MNIAGLEWFGPPERNTLRPLCVCIACALEVENGIAWSESEHVMCLPSLGLASSFLAWLYVLLPFISQGRTAHSRWVPDRWVLRCSIK